MASRKIQTYENEVKNLYTIYFVFDLDGECKSLKQNIIVIKEICSWLPPFCKENLLLFIQPKWQLRIEHTTLISIMFCFNEFAFTVLVKHKINSHKFLALF